MFPHDFSEKTDFRYGGQRHDVEESGTSHANVEALGITHVNMDEHPAFKHERDSQIEPVHRMTTIPQARHGPTPDGEEPTQQEKETLRHVADDIPYRAWLVAVVELSERFTYYGLSGVFQNYMKNPRTHGPSAVSGALNLGKSKANALSNFFTFWCYVTPILGAVIADSYLGRFKTISTFVAVYMVGILVLFITSLPSMLDKGAGFPGYIIAIIIIGLGTGGIKSNVSPLIAEQYTEKLMRVKTLKKGERVIVDPNVTVQRIYNIFYWCINIGSLSGLATTQLEHKVDFWAAFLLPFCFFWLAVGALYFGRHKYITVKPTGSIIPRACRALWMGVRNGFNMDAAKPSFQMQKRGVTTVPWDDLFVDELKRVLIACRVFVVFPIFWVAYGQMNNNLVNQAGQMDAHGIPNDLMQNFNPLSIILFIPLVEKYFYPLLRRFRIPFKPITRISVGLALIGIAMGYAAIVQNMIYHAGPCYDHPLKGKCSKTPGKPDADPITNHVHVLIQVPIYALTGFGEIFASVTGLEYAYTKSPVAMKSLVMSAFLLTNAAGAIVGIAMAPTAEDPKLVITYSSLFAVTMATALIFWFTFKKYNKIEEDLNELDAQDENHPVPLNQQHQQQHGA